MDRNLWPVRAFDVHWRALDRGGVLVRISDQRRFALDELGLVIWDRCTGEWSVGELAETVARGFDIPVETALADVGRFLEELEAQDLIRLFTRPERPTPPIDSDEPVLL